MRLGGIGLIAAVATFYLAGCGGHGATPGGQMSEAAIIRPAGPVWCPTTTGPVETKQNRPNAPAPGSFDTRTLLGMTESRATATATQHRCLVRVIERNGHKFALTADFRGNRVNLVIGRGIVTSVGVY